MTALKEDSEQLLGRVISFDDMTGWGWVKILDNDKYLDYPELSFSYREIKGEIVRGGDAVFVNTTNKLGVIVVTQLEKKGSSIREV